MGLGYLNVVIEFLREKVLGQKSPQPQGAQQQAGYGSYAQDLLSRFAMPGARTNAPTQPGTTSANVYSMVANLASTAFATSPSSTSRSAASEAASIPPSLFQDIPGGSSAEKSTYIAAQRERLANLLKALDKEQQTIDLAYGAASGRRPPSSGSEGLKTKSMSEQSFENVDYDDAARTTSSSSSARSSPPKPAAEGRRTTSGNWIPTGVAGWFGGGGSGSGGGEARAEKDKDDLSQRVSKGWSAARDITEEVARGTSSGVDTGRR